MPPRSVQRAAAANGRRPAGALAWSFSSTFISKFGTVAIGVVLARLLGPEAFGTFAIASVALAAALSFNELGVSLAIVRWRSDPQLIAPTVSTISVGMSALMTAALFVAAPYFASAMGDPSATSVVRVLALCAIIDGIASTPSGLLQREFRQDRRAIADQANIWIGAAVSLALALTGFGALGLAIGRVAGGAASMILLLIFSPAPYRLGFDRAIARKLLAFGSPLAGSSVIIFFTAYVDQLTIGTILGPVALGYYVLAFGLSTWPLSVFSAPLRAVAPAIFARLQAETWTAGSFLVKAIRPLASVVLPVCVAMSAASTDAIRLIYGEEWVPAAAALRWLALLAAAKIFIELAYDYLVVLAASRQILLAQTVWVAILVPCLIVGTQTGGISGTAGAQLLVASLVAIPVYIALLRRKGASARGIIGATAVPAGVSTALFLIVSIATSRISPTVTALAVAALLTLAVMAGLLATSRNRIRELKRVSDGIR